MSKSTSPSLPLHDGTSSPSKHAQPPWSVSEKQDFPLPSPFHRHTDIPSMRFRKVIRIVAQVLLSILFAFGLYRYVFEPTIYTTDVTTNYISGLRWTKLEKGDDVPRVPILPAGNVDLAKRPGYTIVADIPKKFVPNKGSFVRDGAKKGVKEKRLIVVGDVHGMYDELVKLLEKLNYHHERDHLVFAGDMVSKGPHSLKVLDLVMHYEASCVRGNHDDTVMFHWREIQKKKRKKNGAAFDERFGAELEEIDFKFKRKDVGIEGDEVNDEENDNEKPDEDVEDGGVDEDGRKFKAEGKKRMKKERKLAASLSKKQAAWLDSCPLILRARNVRELGDVAVVHAGLVQGVALEDQDPIALMNLRTVDKKLHTPMKGKKGVHWAKVWNKEEKLKKRAEQMTVIYGHYASMGLDIRKYTKGLDSNCVRGGKLTAFVMSNINPKDEIVSVKCKKYL